MRYCVSRERLLDDYAAAVCNYCSAVEDLQTLRGAKFKEAVAEADRLHVMVEAARAALERHRKEHGCGYRESAAAATDLFQHSN